MPAYLRFLRGVVDSEDLPLNISRESIQNNVIMDKIRKSIVKKVLSELKKCSQKDTVKYNEFWNNYGEVLKEGLCEPALEEKEQILEICRLNSTHSTELTSLDDYISRMQEGQEEIYYLTGEDINKLRAHPRLEGFKKRDIEVLLLPEYVDDFWVNIINQFKGKDLKNVSNTSIDLDKIQKLTDAEEAHETNDENNNEKLVQMFKDELGASVKDVIISKKLVDSPSCLALGEGGMSPRMEKMLIEQKQLKSAAAKILEINPKHSIIRRIANSNDNASDLIWLTFDQACILEGEKPQNPTKFVERLNQLMAA